MNISYKFRLFAVALLSTAVLASCGNDDDDDNDVTNPPDPVNEEEVITTMTLAFTDAAGVEPAVTATFRDPDGDGGNGPDIFDTIRLEDSTTYNMTITLLNETEDPAEDITTEIEEEDDEHFFCFTVSGADVTVTRTDSDGTYEVGLASDWATGAAGSGTVQVTLKHQPGVKDGTCSPGDTDIEVDFPVVIQN